MPRFQSNTLCALRGEKAQRVPFWEVWFAMSALAKRLAEDKRDWDADAHIARQLGWDVIRVGWMQSVGLDPAAR